MSSGSYFMGAVRDPRDECRLMPNRNATRDNLAEIRVQMLSVDMNSTWEEQLNNLINAYHMHHRDEIEINRDSLPDFDEKMKIFFEEHLHRDPEVRFVKSGSGFFDVRSIQDEWIRIPVKRGDFVFLPAGIYHRFTTDWNVRLT
ncbi:ARD/ARD' family protein [Dictyocaulus viviparus]|uniref:acireductone dioxygenase (Fe(2+)-requiring) n=1 Tax=Dictyocaulus viviparus TaxID=29172 RepID=A0A0D8X8Y7_DICVI|nr:ARD/ARD' family protein [Dictyocaulus viviparus]